MKITKELTSVFFMSLVLSITSCTKNDLSEIQDEDVITLNVPAMPGFGEDTSNSRTEYIDDGIKPSVKWVVGDKIYIGSLKNGVSNNTSLQTLIDNKKFATFECSSVDDLGNALFSGTFIPDDADIAVYSGVPENVKKSSKDNIPRLSCPYNVLKITDGFEHITKNDMFAAQFDRTNLTFKTKFARTFGLIKFELKLPEGAIGDLGTLAISASDGVEFFPNTGVVEPYRLTSNNLPQTSNTGAGFYNIDCSGIKLNKGVMNCYALIPAKSVSGKQAYISLEVGGVTYESTPFNVTPITSTSALRIVKELN